MILSAATYTKLPEIKYTPSLIVTCDPLPIGFVATAPDEAVTVPPSLKFVSEPPPTINISAALVLEVKSSPAANVLLFAVPLPVTYLMYIVRASEVLPDSNIPLLFEPDFKSTPASLMTCMT